MPSPVAAPPLVVIGASVRALAASAHRAGWTVHAADLYADADLRATAAETVRVPTGPATPWPAGIESSIRRFPIAPWLYSGALENHGDLVDRLARARPLAGNPGERLRPVRDPFTLAAAVRAAGIAFPETRADPAGVPIDGSFLVKPRAGAGGRGITRWRGGPVPAGDRIWQRLVPGRPCSFAFAVDSAGARLYGASRQLVGCRWCGARGFAWCGAIDVPIATMPWSRRELLDRLGGVLEDTFGLVGLVGVDIVIDAAGVIHVVEVNPRPTASMELVERATGASMVATHLGACGIAAPAPPTPPPTSRARWAKAVVFADRPSRIAAPACTALADLASRWTADDQGWPALADLPVEDTDIESGNPALTVFARAEDGARAVRILVDRVTAVREVLRRAAVSQPAAAESAPPRLPRG